MLQNLVAEKKWMKRMSKKNSEWKYAYIEYVCVYVNKMDKNLSSVNPHEFIAFCNFPKAREKPDENLFLYCCCTGLFFLFLSLSHSRLLASKIQRQSSNEHDKKKITQHKAFQLHAVQLRVFFTVVVVVVVAVFFAFFHLFASASL